MDNDTKEFWKIISTLAAEFHKIKSELCNANKTIAILRKDAADRSGVDCPKKYSVSFSTDLCSKEDEELTKILKSNGIGIASYYESDVHICIEQHGGSDCHIFHSNGAAGAFGLPHKNCVTIQVPIYFGSKHIPWLVQIIKAETFNTMAKENVK